MKLLNKHAQRQKTVLRLNKEYLKLLEARSNLGYVSLDKPVKHGWFKHLALRDDIARRKDAHVFIKVLQVAGVDIWGREKEHADKRWERQVRKDRNIQYPGIKRIYEKDFQKLSNQVKKWFEPFDWMYLGRQGNVKRYHCKVPRYYYTTTYTRAYLTKRKVIDPAIEKRLDEINKILTSNEYYFLDKSNYFYQREYNPMFHRRSRRYVKKALDNYREEDFDRQLYQERIRWW